MKGFLRGFEVCARLGISDETWRLWRKAGAVPEPVALPGAKKWRVEDIEALAQGEVRPAGKGRRYFGSARNAVRHETNHARSAT